jgi:glycosyltransferase involved in cell wall biosynthesis
MSSSARQSNIVAYPSSIRNDTVSVVVPLYNEEGNVERLIDAVQSALEGMPLPWELILVDDGSSDGTGRLAHQTAERTGEHVRVITLRRNFGQTAAMQAGIDHARGSLIVTMDGDLQNDPADIPRMIAQLEEQDLDLLAGWRKKRQDKLLRRIPSRIANRLIGLVTGVRLNDYGCSLKVYRTDVIREVKLFGEMHRFIPAWVAAVTPPSRIREMVVNHNPRTEGQSKYGISRTFRVVLDLLSVMFFMRYKARPGHFFGSIGLVLGAVGSLILLYLGVDKFILGHDIGTRPLLLVGVVLVIASLQFLTTGVLAELLARIYFGSPDHRSYVVRGGEESLALPEASGWYRPAEATTPSKTANAPPQ